MDRPTVSTAHIEYLQRDFLDNLPEMIPADSLNMLEFNEVKLLKITAMQDFWEFEKDKLTYLRQLMADCLAGFHEGLIPLIFLIIGNPDSIELFMGSYSLKSRPELLKETIQTSLKSSFPGIESEYSSWEIAEKKINRLHCLSLLTGTPTDKQGIEQLERLSRGLFGREWAYVVVSAPVPKKEINRLFNSILNETRVLVNSEQSLGLESPLSKKYKELLSHTLNKLQLAKSIGLWQTAVFLFTNNQDTLWQFKALSKSIFSGHHSIPDPIRTIDLTGNTNSVGIIANPAPAAPGQFSFPAMYSSIVNSMELANFMQLPSQEMPGYQVKPYARFKVSPTPVVDNAIHLGEILDQNSTMGVPYRLPVNHLTKHLLITGTTGSGKTNTIFHLLRQLTEKKISFMVIEPVKTEYRKMLFQNDMTPDLLVFTLGNNSISPFRINPFEILPGVSVQSHLDLLKSVFNASFFMWGPLPQVLEQCLQEIYSDCGWDFSSGKNLRGYHKNCQPTLTDLYNKVDAVVDKLGYSQESSLEIRAALKTRINSLRIGGKGLMLDVRTSIPFDYLMNKPVILELEAIGDDDEKAFIMGIILTRMYEYHIAAGICENNQLKHITIIEEAHRLLAGHSSENPYTANIKGKAVETFSNILAEIRAYGEGFIIAEQIPTKLTSDVIKNTNLKIMHRLVSEDDRKTMAAAMNMDIRETRKIANFIPGEAAVFGEGDAGAFHIKPPYEKMEKSHKTEGNDDQAVQRSMAGFSGKTEYFACFSDCSTYCHAICQYKHRGSKIASADLCSYKMNPLVLSLLAGTTNEDLVKAMLEIRPNDNLSAIDQKAIALCSIIQLTERYFGDIGKNYGWTYQEVETVQCFFLEFILHALEKYQYQENKLSIDDWDQTALNNFQTTFQKLCSEKQPYLLCQDICRDRQCLYRYFTADILGNDSFTAKFTGIINQGGDDLWQSLYELLQQALQEIALPAENQPIAKTLLLCLALQKSSLIKNFNQGHIKKIIQNMSDLAAGE